MSGETAIVTVMLSIVISIVLGMLWIFVKPRKRRGLPPRDRSCDRDWYSVGRDAK